MQNYTHRDLREKYLSYFKKLEHSLIPSAPLVLSNDVTTLFTSSGMQPLIPYLLGQKHPMGVRLVDIQPCIRAQDIEEIGDNRHTTFFEMIGNWSLGDYFKNEQLHWLWEFLTVELNIPKEKLYVSYFSGDNLIKKDIESYNLWKKIGVEDDHIFSYDSSKNWWSRSGPPEAMPVGEIGGTDCEVFYDYGTPHDLKFGKECHPNCDCGRFMEIGNNVFLEYQKQSDGSLSTLLNKNVDFGGGLERLLAAVNDLPDVYLTDLFWPMIEEMEKFSAEITYEKNQVQIRVIVDHLRGACQLISCGVYPSNKQQGYVLRRLIRRAVLSARQISKQLDLVLLFSMVIKTNTKILENIYSFDYDQIILTISDEINKFIKIINNGEKILAKYGQKISGKEAFDLYQSEGLPLEVITQIASLLSKEVDVVDFELHKSNHVIASKSGSSSVFKGGLADSSEQVVKYHTTTHLLHQALTDVLGSSVRQEGSNISALRLRFDFFCDRKPMSEDLNEVLKIINEKIKSNLSVERIDLPKDDAISAGAKAFFKEKYPEMVSVYIIGANAASWQNAYSKELCGGPHVSTTNEIGHIKLDKLEKIGSNIYRIYLK